MKFLFLRLKGYIGIYNGLNGLTDISIDFRKCKHKIIVIRGDNGSGKTTIFNALTPLPDQNTSFIPYMNASKEILIQDNMGIVYRILFIHNIKTQKMISGEEVYNRETTKAYIQKLIDGNYIELNENGNVTSYREIISEEFGLDPNFTALAQLSTENNGIVCKKPAERKKYVSNITSSVEVYNGIYKKLYKKVSYLNKTVSSICDKLKKLGEVDTIRNNLISMEKQNTILKEIRDNVISELSSLNTSILISDPNGDIQTKCKNLLKEKNSYLIEIDKLQNIIRSSNIDSSLDMGFALKECEKTISALSMDNQIIKRELDTLLIDKEREYNKIEEKNIKLQSYNIHDSDSIESEVQMYKDSLDSITSSLSNIGIKDPTSISKDEFITILNLLNDIKESIDSTKSIYNNEDIKSAILHIQSNSYPNIIGIRIDRENTKHMVDDVYKQVINYSNMVEKTKALSLMPKECKIHSCPFISEAFEINKLDPSNNLDRCNKEYIDLSDRLKKLEEQEQNAERVSSCINLLNTSIRAFRSSTSILHKFPVTRKYVDSDFFDLFMDNSFYNEISEIYKFIDYANLLEEHSHLKKLYLESYNRLNEYNSKKEICESIIDDINKLNTSISNIVNDIDEKNKIIFENESKINFLSTKKLTIVSLKECQEKICNFTEQVKMIESTISEYETTICKIGLTKEQIKELEYKKKDIESQLSYIDKEKSNLQFVIHKSQELENELAEVKADYTFVNTIAKYASTTTGIQLVFINLYMGKVIDMANRLLSIIFNGKYSLDKFVINESEFRIPCIRDGVSNDDVSSMSGAERAMISMIISFSILFNASTKYNIVGLDELDGPLDELNRLAFFDLLYSIINITNVEQCIMISHNPELDLSQADVILLKDSTNNNYDGCNVIYNFNY